MAVMVSELFREYEADFQKLQDEIDEALSLAAESPNGSSSMLAKAAKQASQAEQALRQMDMEAKTLPASERSSLDPSLRKYRADLASRRKKLADAKEAAERHALLSDGGGTVLGKSLQERERMLQANSQMHQASHQLEQARNVALEAEQVAYEVGSDLRSQRETIVRARSNVRTIGLNYGYAKHMIESMQRRADAHRMLTKGIACFMFVVLAIAGYLMLGGSLFSSEGPSSAPPAPKAPGASSSSGQKPPDR